MLLQYMTVNGHDTIVPQVGLRKGLVRLMLNDYWQDVWEYGTRYTMKSRNKTRNAIYYKDATYMATHIIWNMSNPNDTVINGEVVHHIDGDFINDDISNLQKMSLAEHTSLHTRGRKTSEETKEKLRNVTISEERRRKAREAQTGRKYSDESRAKMSESAKARHKRTVVGGDINV